MRYVLEGEWSGYTSSQRKIVHREVITSEKRADALRRVNFVRFTDGTTLMLFLREAEPGEKICEVHGYDSLLRKAERTGQAEYHVTSG